MTNDRVAEKRALLSSTWLFRDLSAEAIDQLVRYTRTAVFAPNETIFAKGDNGTSMMIVAEGRVKVRSTHWDDREIIFNIIDRGEVFGEIALLDGGERTADTIAMGRTVLFVLERRDLLPVLQRSPDVAIKLLSVVCQRIRRTSEQVEDFLFLGQPKRLAKTLLWLAKRYGQPSEDGIAIRLRLSQRELGSLVGVRREAMNRQLSAWRTEGMIGLDGRVITIPDVKAFERLVEALEG